MTKMCAQAHEMFSLQYEAGRHKWVTNVLNIVSKKKKKKVLVSFGCAYVLRLRFFSMPNLKIGSFPATSKTGNQR